MLGKKSKYDFISKRGDTKEFFKKPGNDRLWLLKSPDYGFLGRGRKQEGVKEKQTGVFIFFLIFVFLLFLGPFPLHMEVPRLGVKSEP